MPAGSSEMYPLSVALKAAGVRPGRFHRHFYAGALGDALAAAGEIKNHLSDPMRGAGAGRGGGRFVTLEGTICLGIFFRLVTGGIPAQRAIQISQSFSFLGETGDGLRAFNRGRNRHSGELIQGKADTLLIALSDAPDSSEGYAFIPDSDLSGNGLCDWLGQHEADSQPVCVFNLSKLTCEIRNALEQSQLRLRLSDTIGREGLGEKSATTRDVLGAFLVDCAIRDDKARTPTQEFFRVYSAWAESNEGSNAPHSDGSKKSASALIRGLSALGIRKIKSNGIMTLAGFRWRENPIVREYLATPKS